MFLRSAGLARAGSLLLWVLLLPLANAGQWSDSEAQLAQKIAATTGPGAVALDVVNRSSLSQAEADEVRRGLLTELAVAGLHFVPPDQAAATVHVTLSENTHGHVWVVEIHQGSNEPVIAMTVVPRPAGAPAGRSSGTPMTVRKTLLWTDEHPILDVALPGSSGQSMVVLEPDAVVLLALQNGRWQQTQSLAIGHARPWPRDLRGRLVLRKDHLFDAYLPGVFCRSTAVFPLTVSCRDSDDPWPLAAGEFALNGFFASTRNFFTGVLSPGVQKQTATSPFYSAAPVPREKYTLWVFAGVDGQVHFLDGVTDQVASKIPWGSDVAGVRSACGLGWQVLATSRGDGPTDTVTAFEVADREPVAVSPPVEFKGMVTALWTDSDATGALVVSHDSETGRYEAYRLSVACGQ